MGDDETASGRGDVLRASYDWTADDPSLAIVETVTRALDDEPTDIDHLYDHVDPDALGRLLRGDAAPATGTLRLTFPYAGRRVTVRGDGAVEVRPG